MDRPAEQSLLGMLGLAARARALVAGTERVREAVRAGQLRLVLLAADAAPGQQGKLVPLLEARGTPYLRALTRAQLGAAIGRGPVTALGLANDGFARRVQELVAALPSLQD